ncbi:MAG: hypothetical protein A2Z20_03130 [Bdellovibrionales bacterium RBG_16_40_8]|nr:MAG: hypothetical protein A2Z20_03130 [Bdellovibrionales bacterium RBG_16_40_8]
MTQLSCPACLCNIPTDRVLNNVAYCACGSHLPLTEHAAKRENARVMPVILFSLFFIAAITHTINWDTYFFTIIPLKMKQFTGLTSITELKQIALICEKRKKINCEIQALEKVFSLDNKETKVLERVGFIYFENIKNYHSAARTYSYYFKHGGNDDTARLAYARSLGEIGQFVDAKRQFHYLLKKAGAKPQFITARSYVEILMRNSDYKTAKGIIQEYRQAGPNSALFLEKEWKLINEKLTKKPSTHGRAI